MSSIPACRSLSVPVPTGLGLLLMNLQFKVAATRVSIGQLSLLLPAGLCDTPFFAVRSIHTSLMQMLT